MANVIATDLAARKRKDTERGGTETKRRDDTSPHAGKWASQTLLRWLKTVTYSARSVKVDFALRALRKALYYFFSWQPWFGRCCLFSTLLTGRTFILFNFELA